MRGCIDAFYDDTDKPVIIDKSRGWPIPQIMGAMAQVLGRPCKIIATVRPVPDCMASFVRVAKPDDLDAFMYSGQLADHLKAAYLSVEAGYQAMPDNFLFVEYDKLLADPRAELARRLLEYEAIKQGAYQLDQLPQSGRDFLVTQIHLDHALTARLPQIHAEDLRAAWADIVRRAKLVQHHKITREALSVREVMTVVLRKLQQQRFSEFQDLFDVNKGLPQAVVTFLALLELSKESLVELTQAECYAPIYARLSYTPI
ncbi:MAG: segregation/condensation protein A [Betaproteobacteria bacterium]|nr:segregation/condensation protein A [Betaproteobacteria bacterium]